MTAWSSSRATARERVTGLDVARAVGVIGMVLIHTRSKLGLYGPGFAPAELVLDLIEGKAAALFFVVAGFGQGIYLRAPRAQGRVIQLAKRACVLFCVGMLHLTYWSWDALHVHAAFALLGLLLVRSGPFVLAGTYAIVVYAGEGLRRTSDPYSICDPWSFVDLVSCVSSTSQHPILPWFAFFVLGRLLASVHARNRQHWLVLTLVSALLLLGLEAANFWVRAQIVEGHEVAPSLLSFQTWPRPPRPGFVLSASAFALLTTEACIGWCQSGKFAWVSNRLARFGRQALSAYVFHAALLTTFRDREWFQTGNATLATAVGLALTLCLFVAGNWWSRRCARGPLEHLLHILLGPRSDNPGENAPPPDPTPGQHPVATRPFRPAAL